MHPIVNWQGNFQVFGWIFKGKKKKKTSKTNKNSNQSCSFVDYQNSCRQCLHKFHPYHKRQTKRRRNQRSTKSKMIILKYHCNGNDSYSYSHRIVPSDQQQHTTNLYNAISEDEGNLIPFKVGGLKVYQSRLRENKTIRTLFVTFPLDLNMVAGF